MTSPVGSKRVTLAQVAKEAGVSVMTASYTYNRPSRVSDQMRTRVLAAAARLGYAGPDPSARSLRRGSTRTLGVVFGEHLSYAFEDPGATAFLTGVAEVCADHGYGMTILPVTGGLDDVPRITDAAVDGFIVWNTFDNDPVLAAVQARKRPAVIQSGPSVDGLGLVTIDNRAAAQAVGARAFAGATRPAIMSTPLSPQRVSTITKGPAIADVKFGMVQDRLQGFRLAAEEAGFDWHEVTVAVCTRNNASEAGHLATKLLTSPDPPDAIAAMTDEQAAGVIYAARAIGRVIPDDLAVTGWDDSAVAKQLGLTTVAQSLRDQGTACAHAALGQQFAHHTTSWRVVLRGSTR